MAMHRCSGRRCQSLLLFNSIQRRCDTFIGIDIRLANSQSFRRRSPIGRVVQVSWIIDVDATHRLHIPDAWAIQLKKKTVGLAVTSVTVSVLGGKKKIFVIRNRNFSRNSAAPQNRPKCVIEKKRKFSSQRFAIKIVTINKKPQWTELKKTKKKKQC